MKKLFILALSMILVPMAYATDTNLADVKVITQTTTMAGTGGQTTLFFEVNLDTPIGTLMDRIENIVGNGLFTKNFIYKGENYFSKPHLTLKDIGFTRKKPFSPATPYNSVFTTLIDNPNLLSKQLGSYIKGY